MDGQQGSPENAADANPDSKGNGELENGNPNGQPEGSQGSPETNPSTPADAQKTDDTEFILLCVLLIATLGFVTFLGIHASRKRFRR